MNTATIKTMNKESRRAAAPTPSYVQICDRAADLARKTTVDRALIKLIYWPAGATPPEEPLCFFMGWAKRLRAMAAAQLQEELAALPRPKLRKRKKHHPAKPARGWSRKPVHPPKRRRGYLPLWTNPNPPGPPKRPANPPAQRPGRRDRETPAFDDRLFDNHIAPRKIRTGTRPKMV